MKKLLFLVLILAFLGGTFSAYAQQYRRDGNNLDSRPHPRDGACFYTTAPFRGQRFCMSAGERRPNLPDNFGDNISSIEVFGNARVRIFNDSDYRNGSFEVRRTVPDLRALPFRGGHTWNNRVSSIMVSFGGGADSRYGRPYRRDNDNQGQGYGPGYGRQGGNNLNGRSHPRDGACFYTTAPFRGQRFCMSAGERRPNLPDNFGDNISSIEVFGNARVRIFNDSNYRNGSFEVRRTVPNLRALPFRGGHTWNNRVSSIRVSFGSGGASRYGRPYRRDNDNQGQGYGQRYDRQSANNRDSRPHPRDGACFYMTAPFRGQRFCMRAGQRMRNLPDNFGDNISSVEIFGNARVRIFNDSDYRNGSFEIWRTVPDLRALPFRGGHTWNNRVSSIIVY